MDHAVTTALPLGATYLGAAGTAFQVWAPRVVRLAVHQVAPVDRLLPLKPASQGYFRGVFADIEPGALYFYRLDDKLERPDPASRAQPQGVHGPSQVVNPDFPWRDHAWQGPALKDYVIYELHIGTFTDAGTFAAVTPYLDDLKALGITALELMPVTPFPGSRNWGYDGVYPFAVHAAYGGPEGLKRLVDACHQRGLAVILDVVYNHLGPEGNYLADFGPYFTERYHTPWGPAINFDGPGSDAVRRFFIDNALSWLTDFHIDALRLDALHAVFDFSARHFLAELAEAVHKAAERLGRRVYLMGESDLNDVRLLRPPALGGYGLDAHWNDDFHHALHVLLTGEQSGYYQDFHGVGQLAKAWREGFIYSGQFSFHRQRRHGSSSYGVAPERFVVFSQNHDQVGNRPYGERLSRLVSFEALKLAAGVVLLSPGVPLLFMGEEYAETAPFLYFISHGDPALVEAVRLGRKNELVGLLTQGELPDPQAEDTFRRSRLNQGLRQEGRHKVLQDFYRELIKLRGEMARRTDLGRQLRDVKDFEDLQVLWIHNRGVAAQTLIIFYFGAQPGEFHLPCPPGRWRKRFDSAAARWQGAGSGTPEVLPGSSSVHVKMPPTSFMVYFKEPLV